MMNKVQLRPAVLDDARMVYNWRNDPFLIARGSSQQAVLWEDHLVWFRETVTGTSRKMFIVVQHEESIGQVRFDRQDDKICVITAYLLETFTGKGYGIDAIRAGCRAIFDEWTVTKIVARVRSDNPVAQSAFRKAGFIEDLNDRGCPKEHISFSLVRPLTDPRWQKDDDCNVQFYSGLLDQHGVDVHALAWGSRQSQRLRFRVLAECANLEGTSVLDVGSGLGDFYDWLNESHITVDYTGIDLTPRMVESACQRFPEVRFKVGSLHQFGPAWDTCYDFVFASGIFARRQADPVGFLHATVSKMFGLCAKAAAFNSLSNWSPVKDEGEFHADPLETLAFCRTLTPWIVLRHDYHPRDFTVYMFREGQKIEPIRKT
jgi:RimJ/RimL family protein N-acetyltransferase